MLRFVLSLVICGALGATCFAQCNASAGSQGCGVPQARVNRVNVDIGNQLSAAAAQAVAPSAAISQNSAPVRLPAAEFVAQLPATSTFAQASAGAPIAAVAPAPVAASTFQASVDTSTSKSASCDTGLSLVQRLRLQASKRAAERSAKLASKAASPGLLKRNKSTSTSLSIASTSSAG